MKQKHKDLRRQKDNLHDRNCMMRVKKKTNNNNKKPMSPLLASSMPNGKPKLTGRKDSGPGIESNICDLCLFNSLA